MIKTTWEVSCNLAFAALFLFFAYAQFVSLLESGSVVSLLMLVKSLVFTALFLTRRFPRQTSLSPYDWVVAVGGSWTPLLFRPYPFLNFYVVGSIILAFGLIFQLLSAASLNRSFGLVPSDRGIKTGGTYKIIRHPFYLSYIIADTGFLIAYFHIYNVIVYLFAVLFEILRIPTEERFLVASKEYQEYKKKVRWRLIPGIF